MVNRSLLKKSRDCEKLIPQTSYLLFSNSVIALVEWFIASAALILVVTVVYVLILNKSPPPEGITQAKVEHSPISVNSEQIISSAKESLSNNDFAKSVELAVNAVGTSLATLLVSNGVSVSNMNVSDMAYLVQSKATGISDITQPIYQLNLLHLKGAQSQTISQQEAEWAVNTAVWLTQLVSTQQIRL